MLIAEHEFFKLSFKQKLKVAQDSANQELVQKVMKMCFPRKQLDRLEDDELIGIIDAGFILIDQLKVEFSGE